VRIIAIKSLEEAVNIFRRIGVDSYGISAMVSKALHLNILLEAQPCKVANIIKQEILSLGGDAAVARGSVSCSVPCSDVLIMGTEKQLSLLAKKIEKQPFGLNIISRDIQAKIKNLSQREYILKTSRRKIKLGERTLMMGVLNVTPDSFSDGGLFYRKNQAIEQALRMVDEGADIIDIGGESTRPGSKAVFSGVEAKRVVPVIDALAKKIKIPISIDTKKASVARKAVDAGAEIINDVSALNGDREMAGTVKKTGAAVILMHMRGKPSNMQKGKLDYDNLMGEITDYLEKSSQKAINTGVEKDRIVIDPGIGFGKTPEDNYKIIQNLSELKVLGMPVLIGTSRKSFIGKITGGEPGERIEGTAATVTAAIMNGCHIVRVHDVAAMKKVVAVTDAIVRT
jgi:dihydropteroate synthase